ncbi:cupin domain-containing protein [Solwaraspora sp. WMMB335]|uniref:cupin domain-containing protein n=1 Tax=Solwaraspora sp. WMMB335 TaxID=3404118 RepID=UPI003B963DFE
MSQQRYETVDIPAVLNGTGERIRALRRARALTLAQVAAQTGITLSTLSRVESGVRRPSLDIMLHLAAFYRVTLNELVGAPVTGDPRIHPTPRTRSGMIWIPLSRHAGGIQAFKLLLPPGVPSGEPEQRSHEGYDWLYVLDGRLRLLLGEHDLVLTPGEAAEFDTRIPHTFVNAGSTTTELLTLLGPQGQRAHMRARPTRHSPE